MANSFQNKRERGALRRRRFTAPLSATTLALSAGLGCALLAPTAALGQDAQKRVYIANDDHTDYLWNCSEQTNRQAFLDMIDYYLDLKDQTINNPPDFQSRFNIDGALMVRVYQEERTPQQFARLIAAIRSGHITVPLNTLVSCYGGTPAEGIFRGMYYAGSVERENDLRFPLVIAMENQTLPWGLASLWAGSGAQYSWRGVCGCVTRTPFGGQREHEMYYYTGPDEQRVLMKWYSAANNNPDSSIGGYAEGRFLQPSIDYVTTNAASNGFAARYPFNVIGVFGHGWDNPSSITDEYIRLAPQSSNAQRRVIVSNEVDFFQDFEATYGQQLNTVDYSFGNEWELYPLSMAEVTARVRRSVEKLRTAEALASIASLSDPAFMASRATDRVKFNLGLGMYWEHDWTADGGFGADRQVFQRRIADDIERYVNTLQDDSRARLADLVSASPSAPRAVPFYVFNPLSWARTDAVDLPWAQSGPVSVYDVSSGPDGTEVPSQIVTINGSTFLRIWAENIPSVGYKVFEARPVAGGTFSPAASTSSPPPEPGQTTLTSTISADNRDAQSLNSGQAAYEVRISGYAAGDRHGYWGTDSEQQTAGLEFAITVPHNAVVRDARLVLKASPASSPSDTGAMRIRAYDLDDAPAFANGLLGDLVNLHPLRAEEVLWAAPSWAGGSIQTSPDLTPLVQAYVNRPGYQPGRHIGLVIDEGTLPPNHYYGFEDFSKPGAQPARLQVTYESGGGTQSPDLFLENGRYRVRINPRGAVTSVIDHARNDREFVAPLNNRALNDLGIGAVPQGTLTIENAGPVSVTVVATSTDPLAHTSRITLFRSGERIDMHNTITQNFSSIEDWSFALNLPSPRVWHEEIGAIASARLRSSPGGSYATQNARHDYLTFNHFVDMSSGSAGDTVGITLSSIDCPFFKLGNSTPETLDTNTPQISPVAGGRLDGPALGIPNQGGDTLFTQRFALRTRDGYDQPAAMRFALEHANPLVAAVITAATPTLPGGAYSLATLDNPNAILWTIKPAEEGIADGAHGGLIARLWNVSESPQDVRLALAGPISSAKRTTHLETNLEDATVTGGALVGSLARQQIGTWRLNVNAPPPPACPPDFNADGVLNSDDLSDFITGYFNDPADPRADFNADGEINADDLGDFITSYFNGC